VRKDRARKKKKTDHDRSTWMVDTTEGMDTQEKSRIMRGEMERETGLLTGYTFRSTTHTITTNRDREIHHKEREIY